MASFDLQARGQNRLGRLFDLALRHTLRLKIAEVQDLKCDDAVKNSGAEVTREDIEAINVLQGGKDTGKSAEKDAPAGNDTESAC